MGAPETRARYQAGRPSPYHVTPPPSRSADAEIADSGLQLRNWARQLADNSSIVAAVLSSRVSNGIGSGLSYEPLVKDRRGELIPELNDAIRRLHEKWSRSVNVTGEFTRQELERLAWRTNDIDGETFVRRVLRPSKSGIVYQVQQIETDWLPLGVTQIYDGHAVVQSIAKDSWGMPLRYYVDPREQYDIYRYPGMSADLSKVVSIPAADMWHLKRVERVNQTRGVTLLHTVIFRIADVAEYQESHRLAARASADMFASINRSPDMEPLPTDPDTGETIQPNRSWQFEHLQIIDELAEGESVNFHDPKNPNQNAVDFVREELRAIAAGCDVGFSQIAQVFDSSYAAQRLEVVDTWRKVDRDRSKFISDFARPALYEQPVDAMYRQRMLPARALRKADPLTLLDCRIDGPQMPVIDPVKDRNAYKLDQEMGWDSRHGIIRRMGKVPAQIDDERKSDPLPPATDAAVSQPAPTPTDDDEPKKPEQDDE